MLQKSYHLATPTEVYPTEGLFQDHEPAASPPAFSTNNNEDRKSERDNDYTTDKDKELKADLSDLPDVFHLIIKKDFQEILDFLLVPYHKNILKLQSDFRKRRNVIRYVAQTSPRSSPANLEKLRNYKYEFQVQLRMNPKGSLYQVLI